MHNGRMKQNLKDKAYLLAIGHFLCEWPQEWSAEYLQLVLTAEEGEDGYKDQDKVVVWEGVQVGCWGDHSLACYNAHQLAETLARDFIEFRKEKV